MLYRTAIRALLISGAILSSAAWSAPIHSKRVAVAPGVVLRVIEAGKPNAAPAIVFIPGWSTGADIWQNQIDRLDEDHRVISFDPRSQGQSTTSATGDTPEQRAADLRALLTKEHLHRSVLVGWSQAAQDVAAYVLQYGTGNIAGIVLVDAAVSDGANAIAERPKEAAFQFRLFGSYLSNQGAYLQGMFDAIVSKPQAPGFVDEAIKTAMKTPPSIGLSMLVSDMFTVDRRPALARMDSPVLIIASGTSSELDRQRAEIQAIRNARFVQINDAAHAVFLDQPDRFAIVLADFLKSLR
jgi:non-heme chloroperoxidase